MKVLGLRYTGVLRDCLSTEVPIDTSVQSPPGVLALGVALGVEVNM